MARTGVSDRARNGGVFGSYPSDLGVAFGQHRPDAGQLVAESVTLGPGRHPPGQRPARRHGAASSAGTQVAVASPPREQVFHPGE
ncbi:MAG TPA: hypothetical protein VGM60_08245 [Pseudonocardia sp.]